MMVHKRHVCNGEMRVESKLDLSNGSTASLKTNLLKVAYSQKLGEVTVSYTRKHRCLSICQIPCRP